MEKTPIFSMLEHYRKKERISFAMPGHKGGRGLGQGAGLFSLDVTELADTDNLYTSTGAVEKARRLAAEFFGAEETYFLTNGTTGGIFTMLAAVCRRGDRVLVNRGCHASVMNACSLLGLEPVFAEHPLIPGFSVLGGVTPAEIRRRLGPEIRAVLITSPSFYGACADVEAIAEITRQHGIPLLVDEAHGAHYSAEPALFPKPALRCGADLVVQSAHKTLNAVNQTSYLHVRSALVDHKRLRDCVQMLLTSSPSFVMAGFLDSARAELAGDNGWRAAWECCRRIKAEITQNTAVQVLGRDTDGVFDMDETRLVFNFAAYETTGFAVQKALRERYNIDVEMADLYNIICIATAANTQAEIESLGRGIREIAKRLPQRETPLLHKAFPRVECVLPPQAAFDAPGEWIRPEAAAGRIAKSMVTVYPPGIPVLFPGAAVTREAVEYLAVYGAAGGEIIGLEQDQLYVVK